MPLFDRLVDRDRFLRHELRSMRTLDRRGVKESVRRELEQYVADLDVDVADEIRSFEMGEQRLAMTARKLLFHVLIHEIRHWAQITLAVRLAGFEPPGEHDLIFSPALR